MRPTAPSPVVAQRTNTWALGGVASFRFIIPVRVPDLWASDAVTSALVDTLEFLSDDMYAFAFCPAQSLAGRYCPVRTAVK